MIVHTLGKYIMKMKIALLISMMFLSINSAYADGIQWHGYSNAVYQTAKTSNLPVMIFVMSDTCHWCEKMSSTTLTAPRVIKIINEHFYPVILHANQNIPAFKKLGLQGVPAIVILDANGKIAKKLAGYNDPETLYAQLMEFTGVK